MFSVNVTPLSISDKLPGAVLISSYSLSVATTILSTVIIAIRILTVSRMPGVSRQPSTAMEVVVESAALYSISALVYTPMLIHLSLSHLPLAPTATYFEYADIFFTYMTVESHHTYLLVHIS